MIKMKIQLDKGFVEVKVKGDQGVNDRIVIWEELGCETQNLSLYPFYYLYSKQTDWKTMPAQLSYVRLGFTASKKQAKRFLEFGLGGVTITTPYEGDSLPFLLSVPQVQQALQDEEIQEWGMDKEKSLAEVSTELQNQETGYSTEEGLEDISMVHCLPAYYDEHNRRILVGRDEENLAVVYPEGLVGLSVNPFYALYVYDLTKGVYTHDPIKGGRDCSIYGFLGITDKAEIVNNFLWRAISHDEFEKLQDIRGHNVNDLPLLISPDFEKLDDGDNEEPALFDVDLVRASTLTLLRAIGEDPHREGLKDTPGRVARFWEEFTVYDPGDIQTSFSHNGLDQMIVVGDIPFVSLCEHHLLPFWGTLSIAYIANDRVLGLSKLPRIVQKYAHRLQLQEQLCSQVARELCELLGHENVAVVGTATHTCMMMRGIKSDGVMKTSVMWGMFRTEGETRAEFFTLLQEGR